MVGFLVILTSLSAEHDSDNDPSSFYYLDLRKLVSIFLKDLDLVLRRGDLSDPFLLGGFPVAG